MDIESQISAVSEGLDYNLLFGKGSNHQFSDYLQNPGYFVADLWSARRSIQIIIATSCEKLRSRIMLKYKLEYVCPSEFLTGHFVAIEIPSEANDETH